MENTYLIDACAMLTLLNKAESRHTDVFDFFIEHKDATWLLPVHCYFEIKATESRWIVYKEDYFRIGHYNIHTKLYELTEQFLNKAFPLIKDIPIYKGADVIYAAIAMLENVPFVTCDKGFLKIKDKIEIIYFDKSI